MAAKDFPARPATGHDINTVLHTLVQSFHSDPFQCWLFPEESGRPTAIRRSFQLIVESHLAAGNVWMTNDGQSVAIWVSPGGKRMKPTVALRHLPSVLSLAVGATRRIPTLMKGMQEIDEQHPKDQHWYLIVVGTAPRAQGAGRATAALQPVLDLCDRDGVPAYLESSHERNVPYYKQLGFAVTGELTLPDGPRIWPMWRDPKSS